MSFPPISYPQFLGANDDGVVYLQAMSSNESLVLFYSIQNEIYAVLQIFSSKEDGEDNTGQKSKGDQAKELLAKYGGAYLATSITLSLISFALCYALVSSGIDVQALLQKVQHLNQTQHGLQFYHQ